MKQKSLKLNAILNITKSLMSIIFPFISFPYASRILLPEGIGKVNFANQTVALFSIIAGLGIYTYAVREAAKVRDEQEKLNQFCSEIFTLNLISTLFAYVLFFITIFTVPKYENYIPLLLISSINMFFNVFGLEWFYSSQEDYLYITIRSIIFQVLGIVLLFLLVKDSDDYLKYCFISVITSVGSNVLNFFHSRHFVKIRIVHPKLIKKHLKKVFILFAIVVSSSIYNILDTNMLGLLSNDTEVGLYSAGTKVIRLSITALAAINAVIIPRLSYMAENVSEIEYSNMLKKSLNVIQFLCIPAMFGLFILSEPIIMIICGKEYSKSIEVSRIISPIVFFILAGGSIGDQIFTPLRKDKLNFYPVAIGAIVNIILNAIFIPKFGALGAAIGTVIAEASVNIVKYILAFPYIKGRHFFSEIWKYFIAALIMAIVLYFYQKVIQNQFARLIGGIFIGVGIYFIVNIFLRSSVLKILLKSLTSKLHRKQQ